MVVQRSVYAQIYMDTDDTTTTYTTTYNKTNFAYHFIGEGIHEIHEIIEIKTRLTSKLVKEQSFPNHFIVAESQTNTAHRRGYNKSAQR